MAERKTIIRNVVVILIIVSGVIFIVTKLSSNKKKINEKNKVVDRSTIAVPVNTYKASRQPVSGSFTLPAVIEPETEADITLNASGKIRNLNFRLGSAVKKGQVLGSLDNSTKEINLKSTQLLLDKYSRDYDRIKALYQGNASTEVDYLNAQYNYENTKIQEALIKQQIADGTLIAPISGIIVKKNLEPGEFVNMGVAVATIVDVANLKAKVMVGESNIYSVKQNMKVSIHSDIYPDKDFKGTVRYVSPRGDDSHNYEVEIAIENDKSAPLKGGTFIKVDFNLPDEGNVLQIPKMALVEGIKNPYIFIVKNNKAVQQKIVIGKEMGENIEVLEGLSEGDEVITSGQINLSDGKLVEVINNK